MVTAWGDSGGDINPLSENPWLVRVTDSDRDIPDDAVSQDRQTYAYDEYNDPGHVEGPGWYFNYSDGNHPYIMNVTTLSEVPRNYCEGKVWVTGSYKIKQGNSASATGLHYFVGPKEGIDICDYETRIDWDPQKEGEPTIVENNPTSPPPTELEVTWSFSNHEVPQNTWVRITTDLWLEWRNVVKYRDVYFSYDSRNADSPPSIEWEIETPTMTDSLPTNATGGNVIGAFQIFADELATQLIAEYRLQHEYEYDQDPEQHTFTLHSLEPVESGATVWVGSFQFGHTYGHLDDENLWSTPDWLEVIPSLQEFPPDGQIQIILSWEDWLPYPQISCPGVGACCDPSTTVCTENQPAAACTAPSEFYFGQTCALLDPLCGQSNCPEGQRYGDVEPPLCPSNAATCDPVRAGDCDVDVDDILLVLDDFTGRLFPPRSADIEPCGGGVGPDGLNGDGDTDVDDILAVLDAFSGTASCPDSCPGCP